jgi:hypothetical protein
MSFIAAVLILNLEAADAFVCFANLLNRPCHVAFFCLNQSLVSILNSYELFLCRNFLTGKFCRSDGNRFTELTVWSRVFVEKLRVAQLVKKFPVFDGT